MCTLLGRYIIKTLEAGEAMGSDKKLISVDEPVLNQYKDYGIQ